MNDSRSTTAILKLSLEAIEMVDAIDRYGSFAAAAEHLYRVPSTISYAVGKLESQLGIALFERRGPRVTLTPAGAEMLKEGRWLLRAAGDLESRMRQVATGFEAEVRLIHDSLIPIGALLDDVRDFEAMNCGTRLRVGTEVMSGVWEALREGRADIVIATGEGPSGGGYKAVQVGSVDFIFCVAPSHALARLKRPLTRDDLLDHTAVVIADSARSGITRTAGLLSGQKRLTVASVAAKIACLIAGLGHGYVPQACVQRELKRGDLVALETDEPRLGETFWLAWQPAQSGEALKWWRSRLDRPLIPGLLAQPHSSG